MCAKRLVQWALLQAAVLAAGPSWALEIHPLFVDAAGQTWSGDPARQAVIAQAIGDWETRIMDAGTFDVTFTFSLAGTSSYLARWQASGSPPTGTDIYPWTPGISHSITFNASYFTGNPSVWWDPTPVTGGDLPFSGWDALSIARHELGHAMGFTTGLYLDNYGTRREIDRWLSHVSGAIFDSGGLNVSLAGTNNLAHVLNGGATANDLMIPSLVNGVRREVGRTDLEMLALAERYTVILLRGDFSADNQVGLADIDLLFTEMGTASPPTSAKFDLVRDHAINLADVTELVGNILQTSMADTNLDHVVDILDLGNLANKYGQPGRFEDGDTDGNGIVNILDLGNLAADYGEHFPLGAVAGFAAVPEPASAVLFLGVAGLLASRRRPSRRRQAWPLTGPRPKKASQGHKMEKQFVPVNCFFISCLPPWPMSRKYSSLQTAGVMNTSCP